MSVLIRRNKNGEIDWTEELIGELRRLIVVDHKSFREAGRDLGISPNAVHGRMKRADFGLPPYEPRRAEPRWHPDRMGAGSQPLPAFHPISWEAIGFDRLREVVA